MSQAENRSLLFELGVEELRLGCANRKTNLSSSEQFCLELFRRAIVANDQHCWSIIYEQFQGLVLTWIRRMTGDDQTIGNTSVADLVVEAFASFWRSYKAEKLEGADFAQVLAYLKKCSATTVLQARRKVAKQPVIQSIDEHSSVSRIDPSAHELWSILRSICKNESDNSQEEKDLVILYMSLVGGCKPTVILKLHSDLFRDVDEINDIRKALRARCARRQELRDIYKDDYE